MGKGGRGVVVGVGEQVRSETFLLDLPARGRQLGSSRACGSHSLRQHVLDLGGVVEQLPNLDGQDQIFRSLPLARLQRLAGLDDVVTRVLRRAHERLLVRHVQQPLERLARDSPPLLLGVHARQQGDLNQHARGEVRGLEQLDVEVHVERQQPSLLDELLLRRELGPVSLDRLGKELLLSLGREHLGQDCLALADVSTAERREAELHDSPVVQDLSGDVGVLDRVLHVRHEEQIPGLVVPPVHGVVEDVDEDGAGAQQRRFRAVDVDAKEVDEGGWFPGDTERRDLGCEAVDALRGGLFKVFDDDVGLAGSARAPHDASRLFSPLRRRAPNGA